MPIEDVDYLKSHSKKETYVFLVDSADRDKAIYPTPSSYVVSFTTPFANAIGLDVLDATIPRTQYNIDVYNNTISFIIHDNSLIGVPIDPSLFITVAISPGDYSIQTFLPIMNSSLTAKVITKQIIITQYDASGVATQTQTINGNSVISVSSRTVVASETIVGPATVTVTIPNSVSSFTWTITDAKEKIEVLVGAVATNITSSIFAETQSNPPEITSIMMFQCPYPFVFDMMASTVAETIGFDTYTQTTEASKSDLQKRYTIGLVTDSTNNSQLYHSVDILDHTIALGRSYTVFEGPRGVINSVPFVGGILAAQSFEITSRTYLTQVWAACSGSGSVYWRIFYDLSSGGAPGVPVPSASGNINIVASDGTLSQADTVIPVMLVEGKYWIQFSSISQDAGLLYNDVVGNTEALIKSTLTTGWTNVMLGDAVATASINIVTADEYHTVIAPGIYNFVGERYVVLRCPEIEEHSFRSLSYSKYCMGLAMFRLGVVGISDNQINHVNIPTREFHPVGKLSKLTLSFETINGKPYDFKGVNHTLTLGLKYLEPIPDRVFSSSIINPSYNPDILKYMYHQEDQEGDSDDQEENYDRDVLANYRVQEARHMPDAVSRLDREALFRANIEEQR